MKIIVTLGTVVLLLLSCRPQAIQIDVHFDHLSGLAPGDRVLFENNTAGLVDSINLNKDGTYEVHLRIDEGFIDAATEHTRYRIVNDTAHSGHKAVAMVLSLPGGTPLSDGARVQGDDDVGILGDHLQKRIDEGFAFLKEQMEKFAEDLKQAPESEAFQQLKKSLSDLADELGRTERKARKKLKEQWLPRLEEELEELERQLREYGREEEAAPLQEEINRIRKI